MLFQVQTIRQGYLSKRSSNLRGDWKRRFFVLDSRGMLYYYRKQNSRPSVSLLGQISYLFIQLSLRLPFIGKCAKVLGTICKYNCHFFPFLNKYLKGGPISSQRGHGGSGEHGSGLLSRWFSSHYHGGVHDEKAVARHTVNLLTSTIKVDADQSDLRFCFRIISPTKNYTLQVPHYLSQWLTIYNVWVRV